MTVEFRPEKPQCFVCAAPPAYRYDFPEGARILKTQDLTTGATTDLRSSGSMGLCELCRNVVRSTALPAVAARRLTARVFEAVPLLAALPPDAKRRARKEAERLYERLLPLFSNERPYADEGDPSDRTSAWFDEGPTPPPPNPN